MKKIVSILLAVVLAFGMLMPSFAATAELPRNERLQFNDDGGFRIMQVADIQDGPFLLEITKDFLNEVIPVADPDLIVLSGDNISAGSATVGIHAIDLILVEIAIDRFMSIFEKYDIPVAVVFGNHDAEELVSKEEQMAIYQKYDNCIAVDEGDALYGCGTYNVPIYASDDISKIAYNLYMIDSNMYDDVNGGYDYVHEDQIKWYVETSNALKEQNGGVAVPSMMFQHIVVNEIYDVITEVPEAEKDNYEYVEDNGKYYAINPENLRTGELNEMPCPGTVNAGQFEAVKNQGDVVAMFFGHDHKNSYEVEYQGVDLVNTPGVGFSSYGDHNRGVRVIDIREDTAEYETEVIKYRDFYSDDEAALDRFEFNGNEFEFIDQVAAFFKYVFVKVHRFLYCL
ncbi:MAG: metallophosphoesterase [Clostridia bacterium]|nr:metallophosphoesterase [Clostridia bacterium]